MTARGMQERPARAAGLRLSLPQRALTVVFGAAVVAMALVSVRAPSMVLVLTVVGLLALWGTQLAWRAAHRRVYEDLAAEVERRAVAEQAQADQARQLREYTRDLVEANLQLMSANALKSEFVSTVSHELRTPITAISGLASTMANNWDRLDDNHRRDFVRRIQRQARRQERLVDDLLTMSRIMAGELVTTPQVLDPAMVIDEVIGDLNVPADVDAASDVRVLVDADHLYRIVANFLTNASKYGAPPFRVEVEPVSNGVEVRVIDHGDGVPPAFTEQLFDEFKQASAGDTRNSQGVGLGLSIVRTLAEANGGSAFHRPVVPHGACFGAVLRSAPAHSPMVPGQADDERATIESQADEALRA